MEQITVELIDFKRYPECQPDPRYPNGIDCDVSEGASLTCLADIPYPAPRCGLMSVKCEKCGLTVALTVAGRPDDPRSVKLACKMPLQ